MIKGAGGVGALARLQQGTTLGLVLGAVLWAVVAWHSGRRDWAFAGAAILLLGYALILAIEFALLRLAHGADDPTPRATANQLLTAWWSEVKTAPTVFCWRQPFQSQRWPDQLPATPGATQGRGVILIHGFVCNRGIWNHWLERLQAQGTPFVAVNLEPVFGSIDHYPALIERAVQQLQAASGLAPVVVAHSMGGLAFRRWWAEEPDDARIHHAITLGTPHHGTWLARWAFSPNGQQLRQQSNWLGELSAREPARRRARFTCFYSHCDNIVFPPATATLAGADNRHLSGVAHVHMVERSEPWDELQRRLQ